MKKILFIIFLLLFILIPTPLYEYHNYSYQELSELIKPYHPRFFRIIKRLEPLFSSSSTKPSTNKNRASNSKLGALELILEAQKGVANPNGSKT